MMTGFPCGLATICGLPRGWKGLADSCGLLSSSGVLEWLPLLSFWLRAVNWAALLLFSSLDHDKLVSLPWTSWSSGALLYCIMLVTWSSWIHTTTHTHTHTLHSYWQEGKSHCREHPLEMLVMLISLCPQKTVWHVHFGLKWDYSKLPLYSALWKVPKNGFNSIHFPPEMKSPL